MIISRYMDKCGILRTFDVMQTIGQNCTNVGLRKAIDLLVSLSWLANPSLTI